ncbi:hypothetical protein [uncultured Aquabacterium sp.]|jgi:hypothetical protein|uniref:hypothetical protein n=1 Tax=uncultured Aquabacterium sp. TaxID=158753 RepID=UPI0026296266|nr:hypothetical protein [uncultured Aquabacterium sp.]
MGPCNLRDTPVATLLFDQFLSTEAMAALFDAPQLLQCMLSRFRQHARNACRIDTFDVAEIARASRGRQCRHAARHAAELARHHLANLPSSDPRA